MKKRYLQKWMSAALAALMALSVAGCGQTEETGSLETSSGAAAQTAEAPESGASAENTGGEPVEIRIFSQYEAESEPDVSRFIVSEMEKDLNIKLVRDEVPASGYSERLQLAMSDGDYPDAFIFNSHSDPLLLSAVEDGLIIPINSYLEAGDYPYLEEYTYEGAWEAAKVLNDDNIYLIPRCTVSRADGLAVREDWLEKIGFEFSSDNNSVTKDELLQIMEAFTTQDPDGDGSDNSYGIIMETDTTGNINPQFSGAFDCLGWQESDGEFAYMDPAYEIGNENYKELLAYNQQIYRYAHPDSIVTSGDNKLPLFYSGQSGSIGCFAGHVADRENGLKEVTPDGSLTYISGVTNDDGALQGPTEYPGIWGGLAITTECEHPEKVLEIMNWLLSDQGWEYALWGQPGVTYEKNEDGSCHIINPEAYQEAKLSCWATTVARRKEDTDFFVDLSLPEEELAEVRGWLDTAVGAVVFTQNNGKLPEISTDTAFVEAENKRKETVTKIIMGAMNVDEYDAVLEEWYAKGGQTYVEQMNEIIANMEQ